MKRMTQQQRVLNYIRDFGSITSLEAFKDIGCTRLSAAIYSLKEKGYRFYTIKEAALNRYGEMVYFSRYFLEDERN